MWKCVRPTPLNNAQRIITNLVLPKTLVSPVPVMFPSRESLTQKYIIKGPFTPSDYVAVTVTLMGGAFHLDKQIKGAARQRYGHRYVIAWCEWTLRMTTAYDDMTLTCNDMCTYWCNHGNIT